MKGRIRIFGVLLIALVAAIGMSFESTKVEGEDGIVFADYSLKEAMKVAKEQDKLIFIDVMTSWCGPCKMMARSTFKDETVGNHFNENFISLKLDAEKSEDGKFISRSYRVSGYPTLLFIDHEGKLVKRIMGFHSAEQLMAKTKTISKD